MNNFYGSSTNCNTNENYTLLIINAINKRNNRDASYNREEMAVEVSYNAKKIECAFFLAFKKIVEVIVSAYTGQNIQINEYKKISSNGFTYYLNQLTDTPNSFTYIDSVNLLMKHFGSKITPRISN